MKRFQKETTVRCSGILALATVVFAGLAGTSAHAAGTAAGTDIDNTVTVTYTVNSTTTETRTDTNTFKVDEKIDLSISTGLTLSAAPAEDTSSSSPDSLKFVVQNTGNDGIGAAIDVAVSSSSFTMALNGDATLEEGEFDVYVNVVDGSSCTFADTDTVLYTPNVDTNVAGASEIAADGEFCVFIVAYTPDTASPDTTSSAADGETATFTVTAVALDEDNSFARETDDIYGNGATPFEAGDGDPRDAETAIGTNSPTTVETVFIDGNNASVSSDYDNDGTIAGLAVLTITDIPIEIVKSSKVVSQAVADAAACLAASDPDAGTGTTAATDILAAIPGSCIQYVIIVRGTNASASGTATSVSISDDLDDDSTFAGIIGSASTLSDDVTSASVTSTNTQGDDPIAATFPDITTNDSYQLVYRVYIP